MSSTFIIYYVEINLVCLLFIGFVLYTYVKESRGLTESRWFIAALITVQVYCISDILAAVFKNQTVQGARFILWTANAVYIAIPLVLVIFWNQYIKEHIRACYHAGKTIRCLDKTVLIVSLILCLYALSTPWTHSTFYLDELNGYHRQAGAYIVPVAAYIFMVYETVKLQIIRKKSESLQVRQDMNILSLFAIPCVLFSVIQVLIYGTTVSQVGFTMGLMIVYLGRQRNKISRDELTGLNNRREYEYAIDRMGRISGKAMILMVDVDDFKKINDTCGHLQGDHALKDVSMILRRACSHRKDMGSVALYRYGGDEFIMLSGDENIERTRELLTEAILEETQELNRKEERPYTLSLSIGAACGSYTGKEIYQLVEAADKEMYREKSERKHVR